jgi:transposase
MDYWAKPGLDRQQAMLFYPTLDQSISDGHPVRLLDEILRVLDWSAWEEEYDGRRGQPPIPPWVMAGVVLYGLTRRIRSSRQLEYACGHNLDFMWLAEGRTIDHDTLCRFRTKFKEPLRQLFKQIGRLAMRMGFIRLLEVAFDGTRVKANASRYHTWTAAKVAEVLAELETQTGQLLGESEAADAADATVWGESQSSKLPPELAGAKQRQEKLREVLKKLQEADAARKTDGIDPRKNPAQLPQADTDSRVMPNKEGGYAPNYTPVESPLPQVGNPARRDDPRQPVAPENWPALPRNDKKKLAKSCFVYDEAADCYYCPMGRPMACEETKKIDRSSGSVKLRLYRCKQCAGCPLAAECLDPKGKHGRTVGRDGAERLRDSVAVKLQTETGRKTYNRRMHIAETPFAILKAILGVRQFLLRGLEKVRTEWSWVCTAYNMKKLITAIARLRSQATGVAVESGN